MKSAAGNGNFRQNRLIVLIIASGLMCFFECIERCWQERTLLESTGGPRREQMNDVFSIQNLLESGTNDLQYAGMLLNIARAMSSAVMMQK